MFSSNHDDHAEIRLIQETHATFQSSKERGQKGDVRTKIDVSLEDGQNCHKNLLQLKIVYSNSYLDKYKICLLQLLAGFLLDQKYSYRYQSIK